jgi:hypothetical protein
LGFASRSYCAAQASVGDCVALTYMTHRDLSEGVEKGKERAKEEIGSLQARHKPSIGPHDCAETLLNFALLIWCANSSHVFLNGALAPMHTEFQSFTPDTPGYSSPPASILRCHFPDQGDGFRGYLRRMNSGS